MELLPAAVLSITPLDEAHTMDNAQKIRMALAYKGMSKSELTNALGKTPQAFNQRMKSDKFSAEDLSKIA